MIARRPPPLGEPERQQLMALGADLVREASARTLTKRRITLQNVLHCAEIEKTEQSLRAPSRCGMFDAPIECGACQEAQAPEQNAASPRSPGPGIRASTVMARSRPIRSGEVLTKFLIVVGGFWRLSPFLLGSGRTTNSVLRFEGGPREGWQRTRRRHWRFCRC